jgi:hypothetical protein
VQEERAILLVPTVRNEGPSGLPREWLKEAARHFTDAVANKPDLVLARARLGRVLWRLGQADAAREALAAASRSPGFARPTSSSRTIG